MRLKTFTGPTMHDVMRQIKKDLGDDAVIISSRSQDDGSLRVTAAIEDNAVSDPVEVVDDFDVIVDPAALFGGIKDYDSLPDEDADSRLDQVSHALTRHNVPGFLHEKIMAHAEQNLQKTTQATLASAFKNLFDFDPLPVKHYERPVMLVGQPGAGKTTTIAKLAARAVFHKLKTVVITADTVRAGGVEQLAAFTRVLQLELIKVNNPEQLKKALQDHAKADYVLIDCPGLNAFSPEAMKELHSYIKVAPMDLIVTIPGGMDMEESVEIARAFSILGAKWILPTRIDMSRRLGGILAAADQGNLSFVGMGNKPDIADGFIDMNADILAELLLPKVEAKR